jgi:PEP-CTERM motif
MRKVALGCLLLAAAGVASATTTFIAQGTSSGGNTVYAQAEFTFSNNTLALTLTNLLVNPTSVAQNISDFEFTIAAFSGVTSTLTPYNGTATNTEAPQLVTINGTGTNQFVIGGAADPGWAFAYSAGNFSLNGLAGSANGPAYTIVGGPGSGPAYSNANSSLTSAPHNPMIYQTATWVFALPGANAVSNYAITNVNFSFGTTAGNDYSCTTQGCYSPEPGSWMLLGTGLAGLIFFARKAARKRTA